jgi:glycerol-3-phosphate dehydrogenase
MSSISIIGSGNMASAISALALEGGNTVEILGQHARQRRHGRNVGRRPDR